MRVQERIQYHFKFLDYGLDALAYKNIKRRINFSQSSLWLEEFKIPQLNTTRSIEFPFLLPTLTSLAP
jgi:hypothetical protein